MECQGNPCRARGLVNAGRGARVILSQPSTLDRLCLERALTRDTASLFSPPDTIGPYRVLHQVGAGVLGPVFRALDPARERMVGIKLFRLDMTPEQAAALAEQLTALVDRLPEHQGLVRPLSAGVEGSTAYLVTEYVAADSIDQRLRRKVPTPLEQALPLLFQVAAALDAAAKGGDYHGALHPRDVLVSTRGVVGITGVGIMQALETVGWRPPFRRPYAAPERLAGRAWDARADVFTLAVLAVELVTGRRPLMPENGAALSWVTVDDPARTAMVRDALAVALDEDPAQRDASAGEWVERLYRAARGEALAEDRSTEVVVVPSVAATPAVDVAPTAPQVDAIADGVAAHVATSVPPAPAETPAPDELESANLFTSESAAGSTVARGADALKAGDATLQASPGFDEAVIDIVEMPEPDPAGGGVLHEVGRRDVASILSEAPRRESWVDEPTIEDRRGESFDAADVMAIDAGVPLQEPDEPATPSRRPLTALLVAAVLLALVGGYWYGTRGPGPSPLAGDETALTARPDPPSPAPPGDAARPAPSEPQARTPPPSSPRQQTARSQPPPARPGDARPPANRRPDSGPPAVAAAPVAVHDGRMLVRSSPANAIVQIDGVERGRTPVAIRNLEYGQYRVAVMLPGHASAEREVTLTRDIPAAAMTFNLAPGSGPDRPQPQVGAAVSPEPEAPARPPSTIDRRAEAEATALERPPVDTRVGSAGSLEIASRPRGARVFLNGQPVGITPLRISGLTPGPHTIRLEQSGYRSWTDTVNAVTAHLTRVSASLEPASQR